ncbi:hypothetical protein C8J57DRAFT_1531246 [Mycena rebaudengoi]|nr:hypothetical protein C8J57DRAFT_1531246 [Mycena rebaudengoi]
MSAFSHQRPVHATEDEEEQLSTFTNYGYEQFTNTWIGQPAVNFGAPRNHYDIQKMRDFYDYMASGRESDPTTGDRFQYVVVHDEAITASNQRAQAGQFSIKRDYDSALAIRLQGSTHLKLRFAVDEGGHTAQDPSEHTTCLFGTSGASSRNNIYLLFGKRTPRHTPRIITGMPHPSMWKWRGLPITVLQLLLAQYGVPDFMEVFQTVLKAACPWAVTVEEGTQLNESFDLLFPVADATAIDYLNHPGWSMQTAWSTLMKVKMFRKKTHNGYSTHLYPAGKKPTQMIRILITADKPPPTRETKPVLDAQKLEQYIENNVPEDNHVAPVTAETILVQHANRLQITAAQQEQLMRRPPGTRVPAYINIWEEEEESSSEENN